MYVFKHLEIQTSSLSDQDINACLEEWVTVGSHTEMQTNIAGQNGSQNYCCQNAFSL